MTTFALVRQEPSKLILRAMDEAYMPFGELLAVHDALLAAQEPPTDAELDELCIIWDGIVWGGDYSPWWMQAGPRTFADVSDKAEKARDSDRTRMRAFVQALTGQR